MNKTCLVLSLIVLFCLALEAKSKVQPNIILIMADDLGFSDLGCYGGEIRTPNINKLSKGGLSFRNFYNTGRCCPTRASLMTGMYPHKAGVGHMLGESKNGLYYGELSPITPTIAEQLKPLGYSTYLSGKWHLARWKGDAPKDDLKNWPKQRGFDEFYGTIASIRTYYNPPSYSRNNELLPAPKGDFYYTEAISDQACDYIKKHDSKKPFFLYVPHVAPHWPLHAREATIKSYESLYLKGWNALAVERKQKLVKQGWFDKAISKTKSHERAIKWDEFSEDIKKWYARRMATYAAMVESLDDGVGDILKTVKNKGIEKDTLIIFLSDNGGCAEEIGPKGRAKGFPLKTRNGEMIRLGNDPKIDPGPEDTYASYGLEWAQFSNTPYFNFKSFTHEGGIRTPAIFYQPGVIKPGRSDEMTHVIDVLPTCVDLASQKSVSVDGKSLVPILNDEMREGHEMMYWEHEGNSAVRLGQWKLVRRHGHDWELYNLEVDPLELKDLSQAKPEMSQKLKKNYLTWASLNGVKPWVGNQTPIGGLSKTLTK